MAHRVGYLQQASPLSCQHSLTKDAVTTAVEVWPAMWATMAAPSITTDQVHLGDPEVAKADERAC